MIPFNETYAKMLSEDSHHNYFGFIHAMETFFSGINFKEKTVLEIGSGKGLLSIYIAMQRAKRIVSMEPEMVGSTSGVIAVQRSRISQLGLKNIEIQTHDFESFDSGDEKFDVIVTRSSINHIYESEHHALRHKETYERYIQIVGRMYELLNPGGVVVASDACRYGFFMMMKGIGIRRPWLLKKKTNINWRVHQNPGAWKKIFLAGRFSQVDIAYPIPYKLRGMKHIIGTSAANFFLDASFIIHAYR